MDGPSAQGETTSLFEKLQKVLPNSAGFFSAPFGNGTDAASGGPSLPSSEWEHDKIVDWEFVLGSKDMCDVLHGLGDTVELSKLLVACARLSYMPRLTVLDVDDDLTKDAGEGYVVARRCTYEFTAAAVAHIYCQANHSRGAFDVVADGVESITVSVPVLPVLKDGDDHSPSKHVDVSLPKAHVTTTTALQWVNEQAIRLMQTKEQHPLYDTGENDLHSAKKRPMQTPTYPTFSTGLHLSPPTTAGKYELASSLVKLLHRAIDPIDRDWRLLPEQPTEFLLAYDVAEWATPTNTNAGFKRDVDGLSQEGQEQQKKSKVTPRES